MRPICLLPLTAILLLAGCPDEGAVDGPEDTAAVQDVADTSTAEDVEVDAGPPDTGPVDTGPPTHTAKRVDELTYGPPTTWAKPLEAYIKAVNKNKGNWNFKRAVHDLAVYQGRLYMGYGDATANVASAYPIAARYFDKPTSTKLVDEFVTAEEEIHRYRRIGDELWIAGVDATEDNWLGNVYFRTPDKPWVKKRTVQNGVHVHDIALWNGAHYAVGSGAEKEKWMEGSVWGHLWKSTDKGDTWEIVSKHWNAEDGDARWTEMLSVKDKLYVFGYWWKASDNNSAPPPQNATYTGTGYPPTADNLPGSHPLKAARILATWSTGPDSGVVMGVNYLQKTPGYAAWRVAGDDVQQIEKLKDQTVIDVHHHLPSGEILLMTRNGTGGTGSGGNTVWTIRIWRTVDFVAFDKLVEFPSGEMPMSMAWWKGHIYLGASEGQIWRTAAYWK